MLIVFATIDVEPDERDEVVAKMRARLEDVAPKQNGAIDFELLLSTDDPGTIHVFQTWPSDEAFATWGKDPAHVAFQQEFGRLTKGGSARYYLARPVGRG